MKLLWCDGLTRSRAVLASALYVLCAAGCEAGELWQDNMDQAPEVVSDPAEVSDPDVEDNSAQEPTPSQNSDPVDQNNTSPQPENNQQTSDHTTAPDRCAVPEPTPVRRLSHFEYWNTVRALFPGLVLPELELPADNRPHEFDNDADALKVTGTLVERYFEVGEAITDALVEQGLLVALAPCAASAPSTPEQIASCGRELVEVQGKRLFRRPLTPAQIDAYSVMFDQDPELAGATFAQRQALTLQLMLAAPEFLYRFEAPSDAVEPGVSQPLDAYGLATRLSYFLWGTMPDDELFALAEDGTLVQPGVLRAQAERMLADERSRETFTHFHEQWLDIERLGHVTKKEAEGFDDGLRDAMWAQGRMFIDEVLYNSDGTVEDLFVSPRTFVNAQLAGVYGVEPPAQGEWAEIMPEDRAGWLMQPAFLASHGHPDKPSPVLRGTFVLERVLCSGVGAPPPNAEAMGNAVEDMISGPLTNREVYDLTTNSELPCTACHQRINPAGYSLENFDTMGRWRSMEENGLPVDATGAFDDFSFDGPLEFAAQLGASPQVAQCVTKKWLRYAWSGGPLESSRCLIDDVLEAASVEGESVKIRDIQLAIVTHPWFAIYTAPEVEP